MEDPIPEGDAILDLLQLVLKFNIIEFNGCFYIQILGIAMGTSLAPTIANLFMAYLERKLQRKFGKLNKRPMIKNENQEYQLISLETCTLVGSLLFKRYIDDIACIWNGNLHSAIEFAREINKLHPTIKVTLKYSNNEIDFMDMTMYKGNRFITTGKFDTKVYQKPHNAYLYIAFDSNHPEHNPAALIKTELIRYVRICSDIENFNFIKSLFYSRLRDRKFSIEFLDKEMEKVQYSQRTEYLKDKRKATRKLHLPLVFKVQYNKRLDNLGLPKLFIECNNDEICLDVIHHILGKTPLICYKTEDNLQKQLVQAKFVP